MKLSIYSIYLLNLYRKGLFGSVDAVFSEARKSGIVSAEVFVGEFEETPLKEYLNYLQRNDISLHTVIDGSAFPCHDENTYKIEIDRLKKLIDEANSVGATQFMVVPKATYIRNKEDKLFMRDKIVEGLNELTAFAKGSNVTVTMENYSTHLYPYSTIEECAYLLENIPDMGFCIDSGNFYCVHNDILKAYDTLKNRIVNVHIKDWIEDEFGFITRPNLPCLNGCIIGDGMLPIKELLKRLKEDSYDGYLVVELNSNKLNPTALFESAEFLMKELKRMGCTA